jgi:hypothetical protein
LKLLIITFVLINLFGAFYANIFAFTDYTFASTQTHLPFSSPNDQTNNNNQDNKKDLSMNNNWLSQSSPNTLYNSNRNLGQYFNPNNQVNNQDNSESQTLPHKSFQNLRLDLPQRSSANLNQSPDSNIQNNPQLQSIIKNLRNCLSENEISPKYRTAPNLNQLPNSNNQGNSELRALVKEGLRNQEYNSQQSPSTNLNQSPDSNIQNNRDKSELRALVKEGLRNQEYNSQQSPSTNLNQSPDSNIQNNRDKSKTLSIFKDLRNCLSENEISPKYRTAPNLNQLPNSNNQGNSEYTNKGPLPKSDDNSSPPDGTFESICTNMEILGQTLGDILERNDYTCSKVFDGNNITQDGWNLIGCLSIPVALFIALKNPIPQIAIEGLVGALVVAIAPLQFANCHW